MYGAIIGDIVGSVYEFDNIKTKDFPFVSKYSQFTDDTVMTVAVASALIKSIKQQLPFKPLLIDEMQSFGRKYPNAGYGGMFSRWLRSDNPQPYNSFGNGSAMRVSPCGLIAVTLEEALSLAKASAEVTHNHPEGIKGAQATAAAVFLAKSGKNKREIAKFINANFYDLDKSLEEIRPNYSFNETCQETVPQALEAFLESESYEDAIRNAISIGGDSDTIGAITGAVAWAYYYNDRSDYGYTRDDFVNYSNIVSRCLPKELEDIVNEFNCLSYWRHEDWLRKGSCKQIPHITEKNAPLRQALSPEPETVEGILLRERIREISCTDLLKAICSGEDFVRIIDRLKILCHYNKYFELMDSFYKEPDTIDSATLEECIVYLTYLSRGDYSSGGISHMNYVRLARPVRLRIVELLSENLA